PLVTARWINVSLRVDTGHRVRWRGQVHPLRFGDVELVLDHGMAVWRWRTVVGFSPAAIRYPILGTAGCLQFIDARFRRADLIVELETNRTYPGTVRASGRFHITTPRRLGPDYDASAHLGPVQSRADCSSRRRVREDWGGQLTVHGSLCCQKNKLWASGIPACASQGIARACHRAS